MLLLNFFEKLNFDDLKKIIVKEDFILQCMEVLNNVLKVYNSDTLLNKKTTKQIISAYVIFYHKTDVTMNNDVYSEKVFELAKDFVITFDYYQKNVSLKNFNVFNNKMNTYLTFFPQWKERESLIITRPIINTYHSINVQIKIIEDFLSEPVETEEKITDEEEQNRSLLEKRLVEFKNELSNLRKKVKTISGNTGVKYLDNNDVPVFSDEKIFDDVQKTVKKAFWDVFEENIKERKYDSLKQLLTDLKEMIFSMVPNNKDFKNNFDQTLDYTILFQLIDLTQTKENEKLDKNYIQNIVLFFIETLEKMQSASEDENTKMFKEVMLLKLNKEYEEEKFLRYFFENIFEKYELIQLQIMKLYNNIKKEE